MKPRLDAQLLKPTRMRITAPSRTLGERASGRVQMAWARVDPVLHCSRFGDLPEWNLLLNSPIRAKDGTAFSGECVHARAVFVSVFYSGEFQLMGLVVFRATQYACALARYLLRNDPKRKVVMRKLESLESSLSSGRKRKWEHTCV